jgi:hypothetical protein
LEQAVAPFEWPGVEVLVAHIRRSSVDDFAHWDNMAPVGREFGSLGYEQIVELDNLTCKALGDLLKAIYRRALLSLYADAKDLLTTPNPSTLCARGR